MCSSASSKPYARAVSASMRTCTSRCSGMLLREYSTTRSSGVRLSSITSASNVGCASGCCCCICSSGTSMAPFTREAGAPLPRRPTVGRGGGYGTRDGARSTARALLPLLSSAAEGFGAPDATGADAAGTEPSTPPRRGRHEILGDRDVADGGRVPEKAKRKSKRKKGKAAARPAARRERALALAKGTALHLKSLKCHVHCTTTVQEGPPATERSEEEKEERKRKGPAG